MAVSETVSKYSITYGIAKYLCRIFVPRLEKKLNLNFLQVSDISKIINQDIDDSFDSEHFKFLLVDEYGLTLRIDLIIDLGIIRDEIELNFLRVEEDNSVVISKYIRQRNIEIWKRMGV